MGIQKQGNVLVVMTNKDVYYVTPFTAEHLMGLIKEGNLPVFFVVTDTKSLSRVAIATANISSIVMDEVRND